MSRFSFLTDEHARRLATFANDRLLTDLERYHRERMFGRLTIRIDVDAGIPSKVVVTPEVSVIATNFADDEKPTR